MGTARWKKGGLDESEGGSLEGKDTSAGKEGGREEGNKTQKTRHVPYSALPSATALRMFEPTKKHDV